MELSEYDRLCRNGRKHIEKDCGVVKDNLTHEEAISLIEKLSPFLNRSTAFMKFPSWSYLQIRQYNRSYSVELVKLTTQHTPGYPLECRTAIRKLLEKSGVGEINVYDAEIDLSVNAQTYISFAALNEEHGKERLEEIKQHLRYRLGLKIEEVIKDHMREAAASLKDRYDYPNPVEFGEDNYSCEFHIGDSGLEKSMLSPEELKEDK